ncbi:hypothetical protein J4760_03955 [Salinicoccus sp. ID82-1]|uniref:hypothetical protein n=1 Tax=Salinicoccus sp. ID82-1 TaxID=2820269 RepID=UPI001F3208D7|nr:hypothetical protein [Salinicoccus sp. ID82-1]MCG1009205.1 hypothetical protein [Salinicoccus sp. ID82-1]
MSSEEKLTLYSFKKQHSIDDESNYELSMIYEKIYRNYYEKSSYDRETFDPYNKFQDEDLRTLFDRASKTSETLIPYANFTNTIFSVGYNNAMYFNYADNSFSEELQAAMEAFIIRDYGIGRNKDEETGKQYIDVERYNDNVLIELNDSNKNGLKVFYKIIQHTQLALAQRNSLYINQKEDINIQRDQIDYISAEIDKSNRRYNNMIGNYISILGIFAAIMMTTFGGIQGFTAIYQNENNYSLTEVIIISCLGLMGLLLLIFVLIYGVAKLAEKDIFSNDNTDYMHRKYPQMFYPLFLILLTTVVAIAHLFSYRPPNYFPDFMRNNIWLILFITIIFLFLIYLLHIIVVRFELLDRFISLIRIILWIIRLSLRTEQIVMISDVLEFPDDKNGGYTVYEAKIYEGPINKKLKVRTKKNLGLTGSYLVKKKRFSFEVEEVLQD